MGLSIEVQVIVLIVTFLMVLILGPVTIPLLTRFKFGQTVRDDGPASHLKKTGTPTMGGIIFIVPLMLVCLFFYNKYPQILPILLVTIGFGAVGFIDDFIKVWRKSKDGLYAKQKMFGLLLIATVFTVYIANETTVGTEIIIPFGGIDAVFSLPAWFFIPFTVFVLVATTNAVNITDGLDGLAVGVTLVVMVFFTIVAMTRGEWDYIKIFSSAVAGGCLGFLAFNTYPAKVFMGDTGSLALGGAVAATAIVMKMSWMLLIVGGIYVVETLSVIIQVVSFKLRGKRIFKMAPLHHHFELLGWKETKVVYMFYIITIILCVTAFAALRLKFF